MGIARKMYEAARASAEWAAQPEAVRAAYEANPPWKFYTDLAGSAAFRVYAVFEFGDGACGYRAMSARSGQAADCLLPPDRLVPVDDWADRQRALIGRCRDSEEFYDPCAWVAISLGHERVPEL